MRSEFTANLYLSTMQPEDFTQLLKPRYIQRPKRAISEALLGLLGRLLQGVCGLALFAAIGVMLAWRG